MSNRVAYYYHPEIGNYFYGPGHVMKPHRVRMAHNLIVNYGLYEKMTIHIPRPATAFEMTKFHTDDYVQFLSTITPENERKFQKQVVQFLDEDCPVWQGVFEFSQLSVGGSIDGAAQINHDRADIVINWAGGLHHAKRSEASGFCYINDIVLGILELLKYHKRVLYVDIDCHHGDGVEEAFYTTNRVMTVSFHKFGDFFPGTGALNDVGAGQGKHYSLNFPLFDGIDDVNYEMVFKPVMQRVMDWYQPEAIVLQCGADSLSGDRLGGLNLSVKGHGMCAKFLKSFGKPMMLLGGGGYTIRNVARAWTYETSVVLDTEIDNRLPYNEYIDYYGPYYVLDYPIANLANLNSREYLDNCLSRLIESLRHVEGAPSVQQSEIPPDTMVKANTDEIGAEYRVMPHNDIEMLDSKSSVTAAAGTPGSSPAIDIINL